MKSVYLIILHWKNIDDTIDCIESVCSINYSNYTIILVNNDKLPIKKEIINKYTNIIVINTGENTGYAKGNNIGIKKALTLKADYILILNNDTIVDPKFLAPLIEHCNSHPKDILSPLILEYNTKTIENMGGRLIFPLGICKLIKISCNNPPDYLSGACFMAHSDIFRNIGLFDEDYFAYNEDVDLSIRAKNKGYKLTIIDSSTIWHKHSNSTKQKHGWGEIKAYYMARNSIIFAKKNLRTIQKFLWILSYLLLGSTIHLLLFCRSYKTFTSHFKGIANGFIFKSQKTRC